MLEPSKPNLSPLLRLYIYGLHGYFIEVTFTAICDFIPTLDWKLKGITSIWAFLIYGSCALFLERVIKFLEGNNVPIYFRGIIYALIFYTWEFTFGVILTMMNACPWDYSEFKYNICGLITLEYAPFWVLAGLIAERIIADYILRPSIIIQTSKTKQS